MKKQLYTALFLLWSVITVAQPVSTQALQSSIDSVNEIGYRGATTNVRATKLAVLKNIQQAKQIDYKYGLAESYIVLSIVLRNENNYSEALEYLKKALEIAQNIKSVALMARGNYHLGDLHKILGNNIKAKAYLKKAQQLAQQSKDYELLSTAISNFAHADMSVAVKTNDTVYQNKSIKGYLKSMEVGEQYNLPLRIIIAQINLANAYNLKAGTTGNKEYYRTSIYYSNQSLQNAKTHGYIQEEVTSYLNIGEVKESIGELDSAIYYYNIALSLSEEAGTKQWTIYSNGNLTRVFLQKNEIQKAMASAYEMVAYATLENRKESLREGYNYLSIIFKKKNNFEKAYAFSQLSNQYKDSLTEENNELLRSGLIFQYESEQKDREILLLQKDKLINQQNARTERLYRNGLIVGCVLLLFIILILFSRFREKQRFTNQILQAKEEAEKAKIAQEQFLANTSHEIRTPMNGVLGLTQHLLNSPLTPEQKHYLSVIHNSTKDLLVIINDLLDIARIRSGKLHFEHNPFQLAVLFNNLSTIMQNKLQEKNLIFTSKVDENIPAFLLSDSVRLQQILLNLVANAVKFTDKGEIHIEAKCYQKLEDHCTIHFIVKDTGVGIPADKIDLVFNNFTQVDSDTNRKYGGAGIGLTICKQLVDQMGGTIRLTSELNKGTTVEVVLNIAIAKNVSPSEYYVKNTIASISENNALKGITALVIDDNKINLQVAKLTLEKWGMKVVLVSNGEDAITSLLGSVPIDVILMDLLMPGMDGFDTTNVIRNHKTIRNPNLPIIAITASVIPGEKEKCMANGMNGYISKPFNPDDLFQTLRAVLEQEKKSGQEPLVDLSHLYEKAAGDNDFLQDIFTTYIDEMSEYINELRSFTRSGELRQIKAQAHKMKSPIALFGAMELRDLLQKIEVNIEKDGLTKEHKSDLDRISAMCMQTINEVKTELQKFVRIS